MKSLRMRPDRSLHFLDLDTPDELGPEQVLVRMSYASICGFDIMMLKGMAAYPPDGHLGHEGSGIVIAVGDAVHTVCIGDAVTIMAYDRCGHCVACRSDRPAYCLNTGGRLDFMTEYLVVEQTMAYRLPDNLSLKEGCLIEPLTMAMHAVKKANLSYGSTVILLGCGAMGQIILKLLRQHPLGKVVVVEPDPSKREAARRFGASAVLDSNDPNVFSEALMQTAGLGYDAVIEASGDQISAQMAINLVARGGTVVYFALYGMNFNLEVNLFNLYWKDAYITAVCVPNGQFPAALQMAPDLHLEDVITAVYPFDQAIDAFEAKARGGHAKVMLEFPHEGVDHPC